MAKRKPGIYDAVLPGLPEREPEDPARQVKVSMAKEEIKNRDPEAMAEQYVNLRKKADDLEDQLSVLNLLMEAYEQLLTASQKAKQPAWGRYGANPNALRLPDGNAVRIQPEPYANVKDKELFRQWCIRNGYENQLQLLWQTTNSITKERLIAGDPEPDGVQATVSFKVVWQKAQT